MKWGTVRHYMRGALGVLAPARGTMNMDRLKRELLLNVNAAKLSGRRNLHSVQREGEASGTKCQTDKVSDEKGTAVLRIKIVGSRWMASSLGDTRCRSKILEQHPVPLHTYLGQVLLKSTI